MNVNILLGKKLRYIQHVKSYDDSHIVDEIVFYTAEGKRYKMYHDQDCCERVYIEDVCGDLKDLVDFEIFQAEVVSNREGPENSDGFTWTFYKFATQRGAVTIRWYGTSNGYYSEEVSFNELDNEGKIIRDYE